MFLVESLSVAYPSPLGEVRPIVADINFELHRGDILGLLGFNGVGKSTLLKALAGVSPITSGRVQCESVDLQREPMRYRDLVGYQPELPCLPHAMTVKEFCECIGRLRGLSSEVLGDRLEKIATVLGLQSLFQTRCGHLSKGQKQRVGFLAATIHNPRLLLLDEPMAGLDPLQMVAFREGVQDGAGERVTIFSTHDVREITEICSKILVLDRGRIHAFLLSNDQRLRREVFDYFLSQGPIPESCSSNDQALTRGIAS